jgi:hypothetical protein
VTRARIDADAIRAAYTAHRHDAHGGNVGRGPRGGVCPVCRRYAAALTVARTLHRQAP